MRSKESQGRRTSNATRQHLPFILHPQLEPIIQGFDLATWGRSLKTIVGPSGSGKTALLAHWIAAGPRYAQPDQVVMVRLIHPHKVKAGDHGLASSATLITFWEFWDALERLNWRGPLDRQRAMGQTTRSMYTKTQLLHLATKIRVACDEHQLRVLVLDNAECLDPYAVERLLHLREMCAVPFAILFCTRTGTTAEPTERLESAWGVVEESATIMREPLMLDYLPEQDFYALVLPRILKALDVTPTEEVKRNYVYLSRDIWWQHTRGNWKSVDRVMQLFDEALGPDEPGPRLLSEEVVAQVVRRLAAK